MAVTSWPAAERALAMWDPRVPVACRVYSVRDDGCMGWYACGSSKYMTYPDD